jgi:hypothetical protein
MDLNRNSLDRVAGRLVRLPTGRDKGAILLEQHSGCWLRVGLARLGVLLISARATPSPFPRRGGESEERRTVARQAARL